MTQMTESQRRARAMWRYNGDERPPFAVIPAAGQESVWDYPRPPRIDPDHREVVVIAGSVEICCTRGSLRVVETASPPVFYVPVADIKAGVLAAAAGASQCEWKGAARYWSIVTADQRIEAAAWSYPEPLEGATILRNHVAFYPARVACFVDSIQVQPQPGRFYGGWITPELTGPFKGDPGSESW